MGDLQLYRKSRIAPVEEPLDDMVSKNIIGALKRDPPPKVPAAKPKGSGDVDTHLLTSMARRLAVLERDTKDRTLSLNSLRLENEALKKKLKVAEDEIQSRALTAISTPTISSDVDPHAVTPVVTHLRSENARLRAQSKMAWSQVAEMKSFLNDYGMVWVGEPEPLSPSSSSENPLGSSEGPQANPSSSSPSCPPMPTKSGGNIILASSARAAAGAAAAARAEGPKPPEEGGGSQEGAGAAAATRAQGSKPPEEGGASQEGAGSKEGDAAAISGLGPGGPSSLSPSPSLQPRPPTHSRSGSSETSGAAGVASLARPAPLDTQASASSSAPPLSPGPPKMSPNASAAIASLKARRRSSACGGTSVVHKGCTATEEDLEAEEKVAGQNITTTIQTVPTTSSTPKAAAPTIAQTAITSSTTPKSLVPTASTAPTNCSAQPPQPKRGTIPSLLDVEPPQPSLGTPPPSTTPRNRLSPISQNSTAPSSSTCSTVTADQVKAFSGTLTAAGHHSSSAAAAAAWQLPSAAATSLPFRMEDLLSCLDELNQLAGDGCGTLVEGGGGHVLHTPDPVRLVVYQDGLQIHRSAPSPLSDPSSGNILEDIFLATSAPNLLNFPSVIWGISQMVCQSRWGQYSNLAHLEEKPAEPLSKKDFLTKLPHSVIRNGKVIDIRGGVEKVMGKAQAGKAGGVSSTPNVVSTPTDQLLTTSQRKHVGPVLPPASREGGARAEGPTESISTLQVKSGDGGQTYILKLKYEDSVGTLRQCIDAHRTKLHAEDGRYRSSSYEIRSAFPTKIYGEEKETLQAAGLVPNATLFLRAVAT
eukprot:gene25153-10784_t